MTFFLGVIENLESVNVTALIWRIDEDTEQKIELFLQKVLNSFPFFTAANTGTVFWNRSSLHLKNSKRYKSAKQEFLSLSHFA